MGDAVAGLTLEDLAITRNIFYIKHALGRHQKPIRVYKLRTMRMGADQDLSDILRDISLNYQGKLENDPRVTRIGRFLRKYRIDELPQFYNVFIKRDMKLVGIRPMEPEYWALYPDDIKASALKYKPGWNGVNYVTSEKDGIPHFEVLRTYLREYEKKPVLTDIKYFFKIWYNIIIRLEMSR